MESSNDLISQFLAVLVGIAIGLLTRDIFTDNNIRFLWKKKNIINYHFNSPLILSFIAVFTLIEYWRVTNTAIPTTKGYTQNWFLYIDLLFFLIAFISLRGFGNSITTYINKTNSHKPIDEVNSGHSNDLFRYTCFLGVFLFIGLVRYLLTCTSADVPLEKMVDVVEQIVAHAVGIFLCIIACLFFRIDKIKFGFYCSATGLVVVFVYFVLNNIIK